MKRILLSVGILSVMGAAAYLGATGAFFSDTETSTGNTFTAGSIDLAIGSDFNSTSNSSGSFGLDSTNDGRVLFTFTDLKPRDMGSVGFLMEVTSNDAYVCAITEEGNTPENVALDPELDAGDTAANGPTDGELQNYLQYATFADYDLDGEYDAGTEPVNVNQYLGGDGNGFTAAEITAAGWVAVADLSAPSTWLTIPDVDAGQTYSAGMLYCFGDFTTTGSGSGTEVTGCTTTGPDYNDAQTDSVEGGITFMSVQTRNNSDFRCSDLNTEVVTQADLFTTNDRPAAELNDKWFFYNDVGDTIMSIDQFAGSGGQNRMEAVAGSEGAKMVLHDAAARYNIATYRYSDVKLSDITTLKYRIYDGSVSSQTPYMHFNVDFFNTDVWQNRLVQVPTGVAPNTWTEVDALAGQWTYSGANWPAPISEPGTNPKTWAQILAAYPNAETRSSDAFLGVRVGHPGPNGEIGFVDWIQFNAEKSDFEI